MTSAFVHADDWNDESRKHTAMKWMEDYARMFDRKGYHQEKWTDWLTEDIVLTKGDNTTHEGEDAWNAAIAVYAPFTEYFHCPYYLVTTETSDGWEMLGQAHIYANLAGQRGEGEPPQVKDRRDGKMWDVCIPGAFRFQYVKGKGAHGMALKRIDLHAENLAAVLTLVKRGVIQL
jgi:hypothetical protein